MCGHPPNPHPQHTAPERKSQKGNAYLWQHTHPPSLALALALAHARTCGPEHVVPAPERPLAPCACREGEPACVYVRMWMCVREGSKGPKPEGGGRAGVGTDARGVLRGEACIRARKSSRLAARLSPPLPLPLPAPSSFSPPQPSPSLFCLFSTPPPPPARWFWFSLGWYLQPPPHPPSMSSSSGGAWPRNSACTSRYSSTCPWGAGGGG